MTSRRIYLLGSLLLLCTVTYAGRSGKAQSSQDQIARVAEIEIDPHQIEQYQADLREGIEAAIRLEPGVLTLYAVSIKGHPEQVRVFEVYASQAAYQLHLQTPHFKKYKAITQNMVCSLKLTETDPIALGTQSKR